jgi:hypothetical protein
MSRHKVSKLWTVYVVMSVVFCWCVLHSGAVCATSSAQSSFFQNQRKLAEIHRHLTRVNKPAVKSIKVLPSSSLLHHSVAPAFWVFVSFEHFGREHGPITVFANLGKPGS